MMPLSLQIPFHRRPAGWCAITFAWLGYFCYVRSALYLVGFLANWRVAKGIDSGEPSPWALAIDLGLLVIFAAPHSLMAREGFKRRLARWFPPALERALYVWIAAASLSLLFWLWRPLPEVIWTIEVRWARGLLWCLFGAGWVLAVGASKSHGHFRLFGVTAAWEWARGREIPEPKLLTRGLYGWLRHPMYLGFLLGSWATPEMSAGHLIFAAVMTAYVLVAVRLEERDLETRFGAAYRVYRPGVSLRSTPG